MVVGWTGHSAPISGVLLAAVNVFWATRRFTPHGETVPDNCAMAYGVLYVVRGSALVSSGGRAWQVRAGDAFVRRPYAPYDFEFGTDSEFLSVGVRATLFGSLDLLAGLEAPSSWHPHGDDAALLPTCMAEMVQTTGRTEPAARLITTGLAQAVVGIVCRALTPAESAARLLSTPAWLNAVLLAAERDPGISVAQLAQLAAYSEGQLRRLFHAHLGQSPHDYLQTRRLEAARHLLETTDQPVGTIADHLGFGSAPHFTRLYKKVYGLGPRDYRKRLSTPPV
ncbi:MAG: AraC family transcriptional regulator [Armatimonadetes bacterium]|nr:AraC family transcriptional regulator [Armatimonadota bacterium]